MFHGSITALITPFKDNQLDEAAFRQLVTRQMDAGTHGLVPCGTTGETSTLSHEEHMRAVEICVSVSAGTVPVIAGCGSNSTDEAIGLMRHAKAVGAHAALVVCPYYNRPDQDGLLAHFQTLNDAVEIPIFIYNVPGRTVTDIGPETVGALSELPNIIGIKDASNDLSRVARHRALTSEHFVLLSGEDPTAVGFNALGGTGCISVTANVAPQLCAKMQSACERGDYERARQINDRLAPLHRACFLSPSPGPAKYALSKMGLCEPEVRLPLVGPNSAVRDEIDRCLEDLKLL